MKDMKDRLMTVGSYLLAGVISCTVLVMVADVMEEESPLPATMAAQDADGQ